MINDSQLADALIAERKAKGLDRYDEVWEGVYVMSPMANNEHQLLATELSATISTVVDWRNLGRTIAGANVSDRRDDWTKNYRIPDVLVFKNKTSAKDCVTHWLGGPELAIEIASPGDRTLDKLGFYASVGTCELLVIDRKPWKLTLFRLDDHGEFVADSVCEWDEPTRIRLRQFPIEFEFNPQDSTLSVFHRDGEIVRAIPIEKN